MQKAALNINCDVGEGISNEADFFPFLSSCSIACGGHYGNRESILATLKLAMENEVLVGAHPSYPDREHFGRVSMAMGKGEFQKALKEQLELFYSCLDESHLNAHHIKAHGALYNDLAVNAELCDWYLEVLNDYSFKYLYVLPTSVLEQKAISQGFEVMREAFLDRAYQENGTLAPRGMPGAVHDLKDTVWNQLNSLVAHKKLTTMDGRIITVEAETFCLHGDHPRVLEFLTFIYQQLNILG